MVFSCFYRRGSRCGRKMRTGARIMSIKVMNMVWERSTQRGNKLLLLLAIADHADDTGKAYPGIERLALKIRTTERTVYSLISELEESGELFIEHGGGRHKVNNYQINMKKLQGKPENPEEVSLKNSAETLKNSAETLKQASPDPSIDPSIDPSVVVGKAATASDGFDKHPSELGLAPHEVAIAKDRWALRRHKDWVRLRMEVRQIQTADWPPSREQGYYRELARAVGYKHQLWLKLARKYLESDESGLKKNGFPLVWFCERVGNGKLLAGVEPEKTNGESLAVRARKRGLV